MKYTPHQFRDDIIIPAITAINAHSKQAERLMLGTAIMESNLQHTRQIGGGPALGYFQMEPLTHNDIFKNYLGAKSRAYLLDGLRGMTKRVGYADELEKNPHYAAAMCRIHYLRVKAPLPDINNLHHIAIYWKRYYNTSLGRGSVEEFMRRAEVIMQL